jgi:hypothetical protein
MERGAALEGDERFECWPEAEGEVPEVSAARVIDVAREIRDAVGDVAIERLLIIDGVAEHEYGDRRWREETQRIHVSLVQARTRALLDLASFDTSDITRVAAVLARAEEREREAPPRLRLAPSVTAALLPSLHGIAPPNVRLVQTAGGIDGYGEPIVEAKGPWPNAYRPSYRVRPLHMPLDVRIECDVREIERDRPEAIALLGSPSVEGGMVVRLLVDDGDRAYPSTVRIARIDAVAEPSAWYPYGGGSFGAEMML